MTPKLRILAEFRPPCVRYGRLTMSRSSVKVVLLVLACVEGRRIAMPALAERACMSSAGVYAVVRGLMDTGMIRRRGPSWCRAWFYDLDWDAMGASAADSPLIGTPGIVAMHGISAAHRKLLEALA